MAEVGHGDTAKAGLLKDDERERRVVIADTSLPDLPIIFVRNAFEAQTGYPPGDVLGRTCRFPQGRDTDPRAVRATREALAAEDVRPDPIEAVFD